MKINKQNKNGKEVSITYGDDNSINVNIFNNKILMEVVGSFDNNLKELEKISGSRIYFRGNSIAIKGDKDADKASNTLGNIIGDDGLEDQWLKMADSYRDGSAAMDARDAVVKFLKDWGFKVSNYQIICKKCQLNKPIRFKLILI